MSRYDLILGKEPKKPERWYRRGIKTPPAVDVYLGVDVSEMVGTNQRSYIILCNREKIFSYATTESDIIDISNTLRSIWWNLSKDPQTILKGGLIIGGPTYCEAMQSYLKHSDIQFEIETKIPVWGFPHALTPPLILDSIGSNAFMAHFESYMRLYQAIIDSEEI